MTTAKPQKTTNYPTPSAKQSAVNKAWAMPYRITRSAGSTLIFTATNGYPMVIIGLTPVGDYIAASLAKSLKPILRWDQTASDTPATKSVAVTASIITCWRTFL